MAIPRVQSSSFPASDAPVPLRGREPQRSPTQEHPVSHSTVLVMFVSTALLLSQPGLAGRKKEKASGAEFLRVPESARALVNPFDGKPDAIRAGQKLFQRHCASCHGKDARGRDDAPSLRSPAIWEAAPGALMWFMKNGDLKNGMPAWSKLPDQQLWQMVSFLKSLE